MKEEKNFDSQKKKNIVLEKKSAQKAYSATDLDDELEKLVKTFQEELDKAQELSDEEFVEVFADEFGIIEDEDLCECCGERRRDKKRGKNYPYCSVCRDNMRYYPLSLPSVFSALVLIVVAIASIVMFCNDFYGYNLVYKAEQAESEKKLDTAMEYYDSAIVEFAQGGVTPKKAILNSAELIFLTMDNGANSMYNIAERIDAGLTEFERKLPIYSSEMQMREDSLVLYATMQLFYTEILNNTEYESYEVGDEELYDEIMANIASFENRQVSVLSSDGKTTQMYPADKGMVKFLQYMFAYMSGNYEDSYEYMLQTAEIAPDYVWLYAYELGIVEVQVGEISRAKELAQVIIDLNVEDSEGYCLYSSAERLLGNLEKSLRWANTGLEYKPDDTELLRLKAMTLVSLGRLDEAKVCIDQAITDSSSGSYGVLVFTAIVIENELGNTSKVEEYKSALEEKEIELSERMQDYLSGKITAQTMFTEGSGEVQ